MRIKVKRCMLLCLAGLLLFSGGCKKGKEPKAGGYRIYYLNTEETQLVEEYCESSADDVESRVSEVLELLKEEPETIEYKSVFIGGVEVRDWELQETKLSLHFNEAYAKLDAASELLLRASVVQSLVQVSGVDYVRFYIEDQPLSDMEGREIGYMRAEDFVQNTGSTLHSYQTADLRLYFSDKKGSALEAEEVSVRYNSNISMEKLIVEQLMKGPSSQDRKAVIPSGTKLLGVSVRENVCYVNFDEGFLNVAEQVNPRITVYALVNSIVDGGECSQVQILVNGETNITYQEIIDLSKPLSKDPELTREDEE